MEDGSDGLADAMDVNNAVMTNSTEQEIVFSLNARLTYREISEVMNIPVGTVKAECHY